MRVIAGRFRRRKLLAPQGDDTRPILDRVKVALFDWLGSRLAVPGELPPLCVLDLFCGGGSLGIEALSRGAQYAVFVDSASPAIECLRRNLDALEIGRQARIVARPAESIMVAGPNGRGFDLVFLDPPYRLSEDLLPGRVIPQIIQKLGREIPLAAHALLVWRYEAHLELPPGLTRAWRQVQRRCWGNMAITLFERTPGLTN